MDLTQEDTPFRRWLRIQRAHRKQTQLQASDEIEVHWRTWSQWETGRSLPDLQNLLKLADWSEQPLLELCRLVGESRATDAA